jgi:hypothetical protein
MLAALRGATPAAERIGTVVNTHANGDHCYGNALVADAENLASAACAAELAELTPSLFAAFLRAAPDMGDTGAFCSTSSALSASTGSSSSPPPAPSPASSTCGWATDRSGSPRSVPPTPRATPSSTSPTPAWCSPATSSSVAATPSCGPDRSPTGSPPATARAGSCRCRSASALQRLRRRRGRGPGHRRHPHGRIPPGRPTRALTAIRLHPASPLRRQRFRFPSPSAKPLDSAQHARPLSRAQDHSGSALTGARQNNAARPIVDAVTACRGATWTADLSRT